MKVDFRVQTFRLSNRSIDDYKRQPTHSFILRLLGKNGKDFRWL